MATQMVPIDPDKKDDIYYRYKMPAVQTKVEGSGNGIKTVIPNIHDICIAINRPEAVLMKFYQVELGAQRTVSAKDDKFLLMGSHTTERMQEKLYDYIRKFVLCKHCRNPETAVELDLEKDGGRISMICGACGKLSKFDDHRVLNIMTQYYVKNPHEAKAAKGAAVKRNAGEAGPMEKAPRARAAAASQAVQQSDLADNREDPSKLLARELQAYQGPITPEVVVELIASVVRMMTLYNLPDYAGPLLLFSALRLNHHDDFLAEVRRFSSLMRRFCTVPELYARQENFDEKGLTDLEKREAKIQKTFLRECARVCAVEFKSAEKMAALVFMLFAEGIVLDQNIRDWAYDAKVNADVGEQLDTEMKKMVQPIVAWMGLSAPAPKAPAAALAA